MTTNDSEWLTIIEAAELTGYNAEYLRRLMRGQKILYRKFSFIYQVNKASLLEYKKRAGGKDDKRYLPKRKK